MKKYLIIALLACVPAFVQAEPQKKAPKGGTTLEQFEETRKKSAKKNGNKYNEKKTHEIFKKMDVNKDGFATPDEKKAYWASQKKKS
jgi:hypothetical protein